jgi:acetylornithine deacetylase/succinyl-diaminopimelate desuccinylase-like protein
MLLRCDLVKNNEEPAMKGLIRAVVGAAMMMGLIAQQAGAQATEAAPDLTSEIALAKKTLATPKLKAAIAYIERSKAETVREWLSLCEAYGPTGSEIYRARQIYRLFRIYGLNDVRIDEESNVIGVRKGTGGGPTVVLNAHHDAVQLWPADQPIDAFVADGRVWCPSAGDDISGVTQLLTVLRAMNAANIQTKGDVWFATFSGEEPVGNNASNGAQQFVNANYPHNLDWRKGDILIQFHGGGGEGVDTGSTPVRHRSRLRLFTPIEGNRWGRHSIDVLGPVLMRLQELRDPRAEKRGYSYDADPILYFNTAMVEGSEIINAPARDITIRLDLRSASEARILKAHKDIMRIAKEETEKFGEGFRFVYEVMSQNGVGLDVNPSGITGWDKVNNAAAKMAAAASNALYGTKPLIDEHSGCGDCVRAYRQGMPGFSFSGDVVDHGGGKFEQRGTAPLKSETRRISVGSHDITESKEIDQVWSGIKHGLLFTISYTGLVE